MKRLVSLIVAVLMLCSVLGCMSAQAEEVVEIHGMHWSSSTTEYERFQKIIEAFEAEHPNIHVVMDWYPTGFAEKLVSLFAAQEAPDYFACYIGDLGDRVESGMALPMTDYIAAENYDMDDLIAASQFHYDGDIYGVVATLQPQMLFYNKTLFDAAGVAYPTDEWTWADMLDAAKKLTVEEDGVMKQLGFQYDEYSRMFLSKFWSDGGVAFDDETNPTKSTFNEEIGVKAAQYIIDIASGLGTSSGSATTSTASLGFRDSFTNGKVAMVLDGLWMVSQYSSSDFVDLGLACVPMGEVARGGWIAPTGYLISSTSEHPDETWEFLKYWYGYDNAIFLGGYGDITKMSGIPVWRSALNDERWAASEATEAISKQAAAARIEMSWKGVGTWYWDYLGSGLEEMLLTGMDAKTAMDNIAALTDAEILNQ